MYIQTSIFLPQKRRINQCDFRPSCSALAASSSYVAEIALYDSADVPRIHVVSFQSLSQNPFPNHVHHAHGFRKSMKVPIWPICLLSPVSRFELNDFRNPKGSLDTEFPEPVPAKNLFSVQARALGAKFF